MKVSRVMFEKLNQQIHFCSCGNRCLFCMCAFKWDMVVVILKWCLYLWGAYFLWLPIIQTSLYSVNKILYVLG